MQNEAQHLPQTVNIYMLQNLPIRRKNINYFKSYFINFIIEANIFDVSNRTALSIFYNSLCIAFICNMWSGTLMLFLRLSFIFSTLRIKQKSSQIHECYATKVEHRGSIV